MSGIIITAPDGYTLHRCVRQPDGVRIQPRVEVTLTGMKIWNGETFDSPDMSQGMRDVFKAGVVFAVPARMQRVAA